MTLKCWGDERKWRWRWKLKNISNCIIFFIFLKKCHIFSILQGYSADNDSDARVYKYGTQKTKLKSWRRVSDPNTARSTAVSSIPDTTLLLTSDDLEDFLIDSFMSKPSRFPAVFITGSSNYIYISPGLLMCLIINVSQVNLCLTHWEWIVTTMQLDWCWWPRLVSHFRHDAAVLQWQHYS